jgi:hypothetical protein
MPRPLFGLRAATIPNKKFGPAGLTWNDDSTLRIRGEGSATEVQSSGSALTRRFRTLNDAEVSILSSAMNSTDRGGGKKTLTTEIVSGSLAVQPLRNEQKSPGSSCRGLVVWMLNRISVNAEGRTT